MFDEEIIAKLIDQDTEKLTCKSQEVHFLNRASECGDLKSLDALCGRLLPKAFIEEIMEVRYRALNGLGKTQFFNDLERHLKIGSEKMSISEDEFRKKLDRMDRAYADARKEAVSLTGS